MWQNLCAPLLWLKVWQILMPHNLLANFLLSKLLYSLFMFKVTVFSASLLIYRKRFSLLHKVVSSGSRIIRQNSYRVSITKRSRSFCLISLATNMLEGLDIIHWKGGIHSFVWSTKTFLYDILEPRYK